MNHNFISIAILGHTQKSFKHHPQGVGEMINTQTLKAMIEESPYTLAGVWDLYDVLEGADVPADAVKIVCSTHSMLMRLLEMGIDGPLISRLYAWDDFSYVQTHLHDQATLTVAQNRVGIDLALEQGLSPEQILYLPYHHVDRFPIEPHPLLSEKLVIGAPARIQFGKNLDYLLDAFEDLQPDALLWVKGGIDPANDLNMGEGYCEQMKKRLDEGAPWLHWDQRPLSHAQMLGLMKQFDGAVHISGVDDPPNTIVELLGLGIPTLVLDGGPRPSLFGGGALFAKHQGYNRMSKGTFPFFLPDRRDLKAKLQQLIEDATLRKELGARAKKVAHLRFGSEVSRSRLPLLIEGAYHIHHQTGEAKRFGEAIVALHMDDRKIFDYTGTHDHLGYC